ASRGSSGCARRTRPRSSSTACACPTRRGSAGRARGSRGPCPLWETGGSRLRRVWGGVGAGWDRAGVSRRLRGVRGRAPAVRTADRAVPARAGADRRDGGGDPGGAPADVAGGGRPPTLSAAHHLVLRVPVLRLSE